MVHHQMRKSTDVSLELGERIKINPTHKDIDEQALRYLDTHGTQKSKRHDLVDIGDCRRPLSVRAGADRRGGRVRRDAGLRDSLQHG